MKDENAQKAPGLHPGDRPGRERSMTVESGIAMPVSNLRVAAVAFLAAAALLSAGGRNATAGWVMPDPEDAGLRAPLELFEEPRLGKASWWEPWVGWPLEWPAEALDWRHEKRLREVYGLGSVGHRRFESYAASGEWASLEHDDSCAQIGTTLTGMPTQRPCPPIPPIRFQEPMP
jgi:hypothetical protein